MVEDTEWVGTQRQGEGEHMSDKQPSGWAVGWTVFAAFMMIMLGGWWLMAGFVGIIDDTFYVKTPNYLFQFDTTTWGWIHILMGAITLLAGFALFAGSIWARTIGVILAVVSAFVGFAWLPWYPIWGIFIVVAAVSVIWALTAHGRDAADVGE